MMMTAMKCPTGEQIQALTLGQLPDGESEVLFEHIRSCERCRSELETVEDTADSLISSLREPDEQAGFEEEVQCKVAVLRALGAFGLAGEASATADPIALPQTIGDYEIVRPIGRGGMGIVFLAQHTKLGRRVALKILSSSRLADPRMQQRFDAEMRAIGRLSHPNIVTAHDARDVDGTAVLVTEYIEGYDLGELAQRLGPLPVADACEIGRRVAVALAYTQSQGFVHRDIKPSNIMLSREGEVKLLDLGLARLQAGTAEQAELTGTGQAMGTADYIAPEQVGDSRSVDIRADIYSLGCTLYKLLTGRAPFADDRHVTAFAKMNAHVSTKPPSLVALIPTLPVALSNLVESMLAKQPKQRPQTPGEVAEALATFCRGHNLPTLASRATASEARNTLSANNPAPTPSMQKPFPWMSRRVPMLFAIAAGLLGVLAGLCLSIVIIITNPDGTKSILRLAEGSGIEIREEGSVSNGTAEPLAAPQQPDAPDSPERAQLPAGQPVPLSFGVLVNRDSNNRSPSATEVEIVAATEQLQQSGNSGEPVFTPVGTWYPMAEDLPVPIKALNGGVAYALVSRRERIGWSEIRGHVEGVTVSSHVDARFDEFLGSRMTKLTGENIRNQLAIIVNDRIRSAPYINAAIGQQVVFNGVFDRGETKQLAEWLAGGLVSPLPPKDVPLER